MTQNAMKFDTGRGYDLAYHFTPGTLPAVVFLGGFMSDMNGTKAIALEAWAQKQGRAFLRFDYGGHGESGGVFAQGSIKSWAMDARQIITALIDGPVVLVGSSMGGWISAILSREMGGKVAGIVGIAAAPDFTEDSMWANFDAATREKIMTDGAIQIPSDYDAPYTISRALIEGGREVLVLREPLDFPYPVRLLQGTADTDVEISVALRLLEHATGSDIRLTLVKGADHRFSTPECLTLIEKSVEKVLAKAVVPVV